MGVVRIWGVMERSRLRKDAHDNDGEVPASPVAGVFDKRYRSVELVVLEAVVLFTVWDELFLVHRFLILIPSLYPRFLHGI